MTDVVKSLAEVSALWLNPNHPLRLETVQALQVSTGFSRKQIEMAIDNCFEELTLPKIAAYVESALPAKAAPPLNVIHILPANAFTAWVHGAAITLLLGHRCLVKPSAREPIFARAWLRSLQETAGELARQVSIVPWMPQSLIGNEFVVAYGSDETLAKIRAAIPAGIKFVGYGHKLSVGVIFRDALISDADALVANVIKDAEPFRLQGCLSPQILYIQQQDWSRWPVLEARLSPAPRIRSFRDPGDLATELMKFTPYLSCVGVAGGAEEEQSLRDVLADCRISRICSIGQMQRPPLDWDNGGVRLADLLN